ncbi:PIN domain-containing protein [Saccharolobus solfataricus]|nr:PIN domain-containing protein [Saccharolobus solfataricus]AKA73718.1 PIN domain-containing protein [Saccharolobus solfataricus]AKA76415.1 PIN domain-containing protein [Saccharolobus solfataricus]AKA79108.1 PIN domain-containing protein [Saccharolobus solfataricus]AZF68189.1 PIN domain-containing protein [Saccharolobus solfataricus]AZF70809.1 PIN domain-containing protein [Saccharolobus solfataricus]
MGFSRDLKVLVDTNILLYVYDGLDPFNKVLEFLDYKPSFFIHSTVLRELDILFEKNKKGFIISSRIKIARKYLEVYKNLWNLINDYDDLPTDEALIRTALKHNMFIFTNDKELKNDAIKKGIGVLFLQNRSKIIKSLYPI